MGTPKKVKQSAAGLKQTGERTSQNGDLLVKIEGLHKEFNGQVVLKDISLTVAKGENLVIMGKSGTGKSVLIKCMVRLLEADEGSINILGQEIETLDEKDLNDLRKRIGFLFQSAALYDSMTVRQNLEFPLRDLKKDKTELNTLVQEALKNVGLLEVIDKMPAELSGGMRKRAGLARTLILQPELILFDEPNTGLDPITTREISHLIVDLQKKYKSGSIVITHDNECARIIGTRIMIINEGMCVAEGTYDELEHSKDEWVRSFFTKTD
jgi:phospholipid/cholesterol/gamma-HCH transport system ATP-binding protein